MEFKKIFKSKSGNDWDNLEKWATFITSISNVLFFKHLKSSF